MTLAQYLEACKAAKTKPVPDGHYIRAWAKDAGLSDEMLQVAWLVFRDHYVNDEKQKGKRYSDWPAHFANSVKDRWHALWYTADDGSVAWTSTGLQHKAVLDNRQRQVQEREGVAA